MIAPMIPKSEPKTRTLTITVKPETWVTLPRKARSALYFAALGLGFIFFEVTLKAMMFGSA